MARINVIMPQMGESITNGTIAKWHKRPGDQIAIDEILLEISTDKVESEIPASTEGRVEVLHFQEGDTVDVGVIIAEIEEDLSTPFAEKLAPASQATANNPDQDSQENSQENNPKTNQQTNQKKRRFYTPLVKALAKEHAIPLEQLSTLQGSGAGGRVNKLDFLNHLKSLPDPAPTTKPTATTTPPPTASSSGPVEVIAMDNMRKAIAHNMLQSKLTSPHVNSMEEVDMTRLVNFRERFKQEFKQQEGFALTYTHFIMYAIIQGLKEFPLINASIDGDNILVKKQINLGLAVAIPDHGLVVPVIKGADGLNVTGLARITHQLAQKARAKKLSHDDLQGGTFTLSNVGSFGTLFATPVILPPQVAIMAAGVIKKRPVVTADDAIAIRSLMYLTHTYDHRLIDGELGGRFLAAVRHNLENMEPSALF